jgi:hypothetical protein
MPDWLSDIASDAEQITPDPIPSSPDEPLEEAKPVLSADPSSVEEGAEKDLIAEDDAPEVPTWIDPQAPGATSTIITWLDDRPSKEAEPDKAELPTEAVEETVEDALAEADVPSWLDEIAEGDEVPEFETETPESEPESPSWLAGLAEAASQQDLEPEPTVGDKTPEKPDEEAAPEWLEGISELEEEPAPVPASDDAPDWLQGIAEPEAIDTAMTPAEEPESGSPDWVSEVEKAAEEPTVAETQPQDDVPDWLSGIADSVVETTVDEDFLAEAEPEPTEKAAEVPGDAPGWLHEFADSAEEIPDPVSKVDEPEIDVQSLQQLEEEIGAHAVDAPPPDTLGVSDEVDDDEVFRWLEDLAETQEAEESKPLTPPTERPIEATQEPSPTISEAVPPEEAGESMQWLEDLASQRGMDVDIGATVPDVVPAETLVSKPPPVPTEEIDAISDIAPEDETIISAVAQETIQEEPMPEIPGWLDEATSAAEAVPPEPAKEAAPPAVKEEIHPPEPTPVVAAPVVELPPVPEPIEEVISPPEAAPQIPAAEKAPPEAEKIEPAVEVAPSKSKYKEPASQLLQGARQALTAGDAGRALSDYKKLIERKQDLDTSRHCDQRLKARAGALPEPAYNVASIGGCIHEVRSTPRSDQRISTRYGGRLIAHISRLFKLNSGRPRVYILWR